MFFYVFVNREMNNVDFQIIETEKYLYNLRDFYVLAYDFSILYLRTGFGRVTCNSYAVVSSTGKLNAFDLKINAYWRFTEYFSLKFLIYESLIYGTNFLSIRCLHQF